MDKRVANADAVIGRVRDGATILMGGIRLCGVPENLIRALLQPRHKKSDGRLEQSRDRMASASTCC